MKDSVAKKYVTYEILRYIVEFVSRRLALACALEAALVARAKGIDLGLGDKDFKRNVEDYVLKFGSTGK